MILVSLDPSHVKSASRRVPFLPPTVISRVVTGPNSGRWPSHVARSAGSGMYGSSAVAPGTVTDAIRMIARSVEKCCRSTLNVSSLSSLQRSTRVNDSGTAKYSDRKAFGPVEGATEGDGAGGLAVAEGEAVGPGPSPTPGEAGAMKNQPPNAMATTATAPIAYLRLVDMRLGLHGTDQPRLRCGVVGRATVMARLVWAGSRVGPSSSQTATISSGSRSVVMPVVPP